MTSKPGQTGQAGTAAREGAREPNGKFGTQPVAEASGVDLGTGDGVLANPAWSPGDAAGSEWIPNRDSIIDMDAPGAHAVCSCISAVQRPDHECHVHGSYESKMRGKGCPCDFSSPDTQGPDYDCPVHGAAESLDPNAKPHGEVRVAVPKAARQMYDDAVEAGLRVKVDRRSNSLDVTLTSEHNPDNSVSVTWMQGDYYDEPDRGPLPFRTGGHATRGVRFYMSNGLWNGEYLTPRSTRQARMYAGLSEKPTKR